MDIERLLGNSSGPRKVKNWAVKVLILVGVIIGVVTLFVYTTTESVGDLREYTVSTYSRTAVYEIWTWTCNNNNICERHPQISGQQVSLETCSMLCGSPKVWPSPQKVTQQTKNASSFFVHQFFLSVSADDPAKTMLSEAFNIFNDNIQKLVQNSKYWYRHSDVNHFNINLMVRSSTVTKLTLDTDESYRLSVESWDNDIRVNIVAATYFGARHGLETLSQLIWWDRFEGSGMLKVMHNIDVYDKPKFAYRGVMVDTARHFFPLDVLKKVLEGMAANKLNVFHWHLTDSQSFPFYSENFRFLANNGAYAHDMVYTVGDIKELVNFANIRGIRVIIEIDAPAHTLSGWEWGPENNASDLILRSSNGFSGQLNPDNPLVLKVLESVYSDVLSLMDNDEIFHIGGDEVDLDLWRNLKRANNYPDLNDLWAAFLKDILGALKSANKGVSPKHVVLWSNKLTENPKLTQYLNRSTTIIQYWFGKSRQFLRDKFKVILSKVDHWYLDCGFGAWRESASPNCDPYRTWQTFYKAVPWTGIDLSLVVGGEVCMWTEQVSESSLQNRIWPRTAAYAERIWSNPAPSEKVARDVYVRLDFHRSRLLGRGIKSEALWPEWCTQNPGVC